MSRYTQELIEEAQALRSQGCSHNQIARYLGIPSGSMSSVLNRPRHAETVARNTRTRKAAHQRTARHASVLPAAYQAATRHVGACPIEAGVVGKLADHECSHGRLVGDRTPPCGCWPQEAAAVTQLPGIAPGDLERAA